LRRRLENPAVSAEFTNEAEFEHQNYADAYRTSVMELIRKKAAGETIEKTTPKAAAGVPPTSGRASRWGGLFSHF
jgi:hypothetical protein